MKQVYGFFYNSCIYESAPGLMGLYATKARATLAMYEHKLQKAKEHLQFVRNIKSDPIEWPFGNMEHWMVLKLEIEP